MGISWQISCPRRQAEAPVGTTFVQPFLRKEARAVRRAMPYIRDYTSACAAAQVLMFPLKLWRDTKLRFCSHEWLGHPGGLIYHEWYFQNRLRGLSQLITLSSHHQTSAGESTPGGHPDCAVSEQVLSVPFPAWLALTGVCPATAAGRWCVISLG